SPARSSVGPLMPASKVRRWLAVAGACAAIAAAFLPPIETLSDELFSAHMVQHELLMIVAAPLFVVGAPVLGALLPWFARRAIVGLERVPLLAALAGALTAPPIVWLMHAAALWLWHMPALFEAAVEHEEIHFVQHACFFGTALLFWWTLMRGRYGRLGYGAAILYIFTTSMHSGLLGALLTMSTRTWYPVYAETAARRGLTPLEDQQLGGL